MNKKIIAIGIIGMFLATGLTAASAVKIKTVNKLEILSENEDLPDLIVEKIWIETEYDNYMSQWNVIIHATISNIGTAEANYTGPPTPHWWTAFYIDGKHVDGDWIKELGPGESKNIVGVEYYKTLDYKKHEIRVYADYLNRVPESDEDNNNKTTTQSFSKSYYRNSICLNQKLTENQFHLRIFQSFFIKN